MFRWLLPRRSTIALTIFNDENDHQLSPILRYCGIPIRLHVQRRSRQYLAEIRMTGPRTWEPKLPVRPLENLLSLLASYHGKQLANLLKQRAGEASNSNTPWKSQEEACLLVLADLANLGWKFRVVRGIVYMIPKSFQSDNPKIVKEFIRKSLLEARDEQLRQPSNRDFIEKMHQSKFSAKIETLIDDGQDLAESLLNVGPEKVGQIIRPYLQYVDSKETCSQTGISLIDIWRYFRHTWSLEYRPTPGRSVNFLVRNAARPGHPVMGIIGLANAVFQLSCRDHTIGWTPEATVRKIFEEPAYWPIWKKSALRCLEEAKQAIRSDDLFKEIGKPKSLKTIVERLQALSNQEGEKRIQGLKKEHREKEEGTLASKGLPKLPNGDPDWKTASEEPLFKRKRAEVLSEILFSIEVLSNLSDRCTDFQESVSFGYVHPEVGFIPGNYSRIDFIKSIQDESNLKPSLKWGDEQIEKAFKIAVREIKKNGVATRILDVNVCGATPVYRDLLGGKLAAMMLFSEDVQQWYLKKYRASASEIASCMAGRRVEKPTRICALTTTSLYGVGSSQYNRVKIGPLSWNQIGFTEGFGTVHMGKVTIDALRKLAVNHKQMRNVNNKFGEGTSPLLRQLREGLTLLGFEPNDVLQHSNKRIVYASELYEKAFEDLCLDQDTSRTGMGSEEIGRVWIERWLKMRVRNPDILERVSKINVKTVQLELGYEAREQISTLMDTK